MDRVEQFSTRLKFGTGAQFSGQHDFRSLFGQEHEAVGQFIGIDLLAVFRKRKTAQCPCQDAKALRVPRRLSSLSVVEASKRGVDHFLLRWLDFTSHVERFDPGFQSIPKGDSIGICWIVVGVASTDNGRQDQGANGPLAARQEKQGNRKDRLPVVTSSAPFVVVTSCDRPNCSPHLFKSQAEIH